MELESKQTVNEFKAIDCLQAPSTTRPRDQTKRGVNVQPMPAKPGVQTIPSQSEDGQQQRKNKIAVDTRKPQGKHTMFNPGLSGLYPTRQVLYQNMSVLQVLSRVQTSLTFQDQWLWRREPGMIFDFLIKKEEG